MVAAKLDMALCTVASEAVGDNRKNLFLAFVVNCIGYILGWANRYKGMQKYDPTTRRFGFI